MYQGQLLSLEVAPVGRKRDVLQNHYRPATLKLFLKETNSETGKEVTPLMDNSGEFVVPGHEEALSMAERQVEQMICAANQKRTALGLPNLVGDDSRSAMALNQQVLDDVGVILMVAAKSRNLKGTFQRATSIKTVVEVLHKRSVNEETAKLQLKTPACAVK
ncbi:unnamed protein product [Parnassius apollo]|uniref:(apollo) hypothetical protein n=1 Tax=Parnassius apollo TaxID=110799 RepID=A0A8S3W0V4_PARAO|nr:unnamed protein product [Parnassius apollo]